MAGTLCMHKGQKIDRRCKKSEILGWLLGFVTWISMDNGHVEGFRIDECNYFNEWNHIQIRWLLQTDY